MRCFWTWLRSWNPGGFRRAPGFVGHSELCYQCRFPTLARPLLPKDCAAGHLLYGRPQPSKPTKPSTAKLRPRLSSPSPAFLQGHKPTDAALLTESQDIFLLWINRYNINIGLSNLPYYSSPARAANTKLI